MSQTNNLALLYTQITQTVKYLLYKIIRVDMDMLTSK